MKNMKKEVRKGEKGRNKQSSSMEEVRRSPWNGL